MQLHLSVRDAGCLCPRYPIDEVKHLVGEALGVIETQLQIENLILAGNAEKDHISYIVRRSVDHERTGNNVVLAVIQQDSGLNGVYFQSVSPGAR